MLKSHRLGAVLLVALAAAGCNLELPFTASPDAEASATGVLIAQVNGEPLYDKDLAPLMAQGLDRANAIERAINRMVAAGLAQKHYAAQTQAAMRTAGVEVAATVFANHKGAELLKEISAADIQARYAAVIKDADFTTYRLEYGLFATETEAREAAQARAAGQSAESAKAFRPLRANSQDDRGFVLRSEVPYNLGALVAQLKPGGFTAPVVVRDGILVLRLLETRVNPKPDLAALDGALRQAIVDERLGKLLADARKQSEIQMK